jgi:hypothetical protein
MKQLDLSQIKKQIGFYPHPVQRDILKNMGRFTTVVGGKRLGKDADINTPVLTTAGFKKLIDIKVGDYVFSEKGTPVRVLYKSEVYTGRDCYRVVFSDGAEIVTSDTHDWLVEDFKYRKYTARTKNTTAKLQKLTTKELCDNLKFTYKDGNTYTNYSIPVTEPIRFEKKELPIEPYAFGLWLGDGNSNGFAITTADDEIVRYIYGFAKKNGKEVRKTGKSDSAACSTYYIHGDSSQKSRDESLNSILRKTGVFKNKHIPHIYKTASAEQRLELLQGLMDTGGYVDTSGSCEYTSTSKKLAEDVFDLILSMGIKPVMHVGDAKIYGITVGKKYRIHLTTSLPVFRLTRKIERQQGRRKPDIKRRFIVSVEPTESVRTQCLMVDNPTHLFLIGRHLIPTHNTILASYLAIRELFIPDHSVWIIAPTHDLTSRIWEYLDLWIDRYFAGDQGPFRVNKHEHIIENKTTNSKLWTKTGENPAGLLGKGLDLAIIDEASRLDEGIWDGYIRPNLMDKNGRAFFISNPFGFNWFYDVYLKGTPEGRLQNPDYISFVSPTAVEDEMGNVIGSNNPTISLAELQGIKKSTPPDIWKQEYLSVFQEGAGQRFKDFEKCVFDAKISDVNNWGEPPISGHLYFMGVDIAKVEDFTVVSVIDRMNHRMVAFYRVNNLSWEFMRSKVKDISDLYNGAEIILDATGNGGDMFVESLSDIGVNVDTEFKYTNTKKNLLIDKLGILFDRRRISIPRIPQLINEIRSFTYHFSSSKKLIYGSSKKDDCVNSLALACWKLNDEPLEDSLESSRIWRPRAHKYG